MRFKGMDQSVHSTHAEIRNVSESGLSFVVDAGQAPEQGQMLKIEFKLPPTAPGPGRVGLKQDQLAWFADVVRVESRMEWHPAAADRLVTVVALRFHNLPSAMRGVLSRSLRDQDFVHEQPDFQEVARDHHELALFCGLSILAVMALGILALPANQWLAPFRVLF